MGFRTREPLSLDELGALYEIADLTTAPQLSPTHPDYRLYLCRCSRWLESSAHACDEPERDAQVDPDTSWACEGHPLITLPHEVNGLLVTSPAQLRDLAQRGLHGFVPPETRPKDAERVHWLARLRVRLDDEGKATLDEEASAVLEDADAHARALAVMYVYSTSSPACTRRVLELLEGDRHLYRGVRDDVTPNMADETLEESMWRSVRKRAEADELVLETLRVESLTGDAVGSVYAALARHDSDWFLDNAADLSRAAGANVALLERSFAQLPPGSPLDELRKLVRTRAGTSANKQAVARRTTELAERARDVVPERGPFRPLRAPLPGMGSHVELRFVGVSDTERAVYLFIEGARYRELACGSTIEMVVYLESDVTPDRIRDALQERR
jgi:hypothetical protein